MNSSETVAIQKIKDLGGTFRSSELLQQGVSPRTLYALRDNGLLEQLSRGTYRLVEQGTLSNPDLVTVAMRVPQGVICLISALSYHGLTTQIPHAVSIAITRTMRNPAITYPPLQVFRYDEPSYHAGIEKQVIDGVSVHIYCPEKTLVDCFKFRNKLGMILPVLDGHPVKRVHSLTEVTNGKGSKLGYITQASFTAVQN